MASSDSIEPWAFRSSFPDSWISDFISRDSDALTKALQRSLSSDPLLHPLSPPRSLSRSHHDTHSPRTPIPPAAGKVSKRKSRASKRSHTTFITADPANFRQMVQQVTGVKLGIVGATLTPPLRPEPQRAGSRVGCGGGFLPTLDTSASLLDHAAQNGEVRSPGAVSLESCWGRDVRSAVDLDYESLPAFPTLESWQVM